LTSILLWLNLKAGSEALLFHKQSHAFSEEDYLPSARTTSSAVTPKQLDLSHYLQETRQDFREDIGKWEIHFHQKGPLAFHPSALRLNLSQFGVSFCTWFQSAGLSAKEPASPVNWF